MVACKGGSSYSRRSTSPLPPRPERTGVKCFYCGSDTSFNPTSHKQPNCKNCGAAKPIVYIYKEKYNF